ncbi:hypothetical protein AB0D83_41645 [Streptomyces decoyicus]|uniref:hypothetical protein n=1 Tax=Streptomyces decoyicus TaxID=249567 RepID=UPI0033CA48DA
MGSSREHGERRPAVDSGDADERYAARQALLHGVRERLNAPGRSRSTSRTGASGPHGRVATADLERLTDEADEAATIAAEKAREFEVQAAALGELVGTDQARHVRYQHTAAKLDLAAEQLQRAHEADERARQLDAEGGPARGAAGGVLLDRRRPGVHLGHRR